MWMMMEVWVMRVWVMGVQKGRKGRKEAPLYWRVCVVCVFILRVKT